MTNPFYQLPKPLAARSDIRASDKIIWAVLEEYDRNHTEAYPGKATLTRKTGLTGGTICAGIKRLEKAGLLRVRRDNGRRNVYKTSTDFEPVQKLNRSKNCTRTGTEIEPEPVQVLDTNKNKNKKRVRTPKPKTFVKPTPVEVTEYANTIGFALDGGYFCDWYETRGWVVGKGKMQDWRAAVRTWKARQSGDRKTSKASKNGDGYDAYGSDLGITRGATEQEAEELMKRLQG